MQMIVTILKSFIPSLAIFLATALVTDLVFNSQCLTSSNNMLKVLTKEKPGQKNLDLEYEKLRKKLYQRIEIYEQKIQDQHLLNGMVVNLTTDGKMIDTCDSLLFSSIRYAALNKLGYEENSQNAWNHIKKSNSLGKWYRHPECKSGTSRDMMVGLLIALSQKPEESYDLLNQFFSYIDDSSGFFGDGPMYVSYLTPGLAESFRRISKVYSIDDHPSVIKKSFSTMEMDIFFTSRGYTSHLIALQVWIEMEIMKLYEESGLWRGPRSVLWEVANVLSPWTAENMYHQRHLWITQKLVERDPKNLFFRWLRVQAGGANSKVMQLSMLRELLSMPQFPEQDLPKNCDRKADYLWQRSSDEFSPTSKDCTMQFNGVDFLWMAALIDKT